MYIVTVHCENEKGKISESKHDCEDMIDVSRLLITYKPKRGYTLVNVIIDKVPYGMEFWNT